MAASQGRFVWYELMTTDTQAAKDFYGKVVGWGAQDVSKPGMAYTLFTAGTPVAGLMDLPENAKKIGAPPSWLG
jgi:predicted enzyme related to lactoylglutathione lyase